MSIAEIKKALEGLSPGELAELTAFMLKQKATPEIDAALELDKVRPDSRAGSTEDLPEPDFLRRAKAIWGERPVGKPLSELVSEARGRVVYLRSPKGTPVNSQRA